jgi:hypothetical protein
VAGQPALGGDLGRRARAARRAERFLGVLTGAVPMDGYFAPRNLLRILGVRRMAGLMFGRRRAHTARHTPAADASAVDRPAQAPGAVGGGAS